MRPFFALLLLAGALVAPALARPAAAAPQCTSYTMQRHVYLSFELLAGDTFGNATPFQGYISFIGPDDSGPFGPGTTLTVETPGQYQFVTDEDGGAVLQLCTSAPAPSPTATSSPTATATSSATSSATSAPTATATSSATSSPTATLLPTPAAFGAGPVLPAMVAVAGAATQLSATQIGMYLLGLVVLLVMFGLLWRFIGNRRNEY